MYKLNKIIKIINWKHIRKLHLKRSNKTKRRSRYTFCSSNSKTTYFASSTVQVLLSSSHQRLFEVVNEVLVRFIVVTSTQEAVKRRPHVLEFAPILVQVDPRAAYHLPRKSRFQRLKRSRPIREKKN